MSKKDDKFNELINLQPLEIKDWVIDIDKLLTSSGCKAAVDNKGNFTYTSRQSNKIICRITMNESGCSVRPNTNHAASSDKIASLLPECMLYTMRNSRGCGGCKEKNPNFVQCKHGGPYQFTQNNERFESCRFVGFNFSLGSVDERNFLKKWIIRELTA